MSHLRALVPSFRFILICKFVFIQLSIQQSLNPDCNFIILHNRVESLNHFGLFLCHVGLFLRHIGLFVTSRLALCYVTLGSLLYHIGLFVMSRWVLYRTILGALFQCLIWPNFSTQETFFLQKARVLLFTFYSADGWVDCLIGPQIRATKIFSSSSASSGDKEDTSSDAEKRRDDNSSNDASSVVGKSALISTSEVA